MDIPPTLPELEILPPGSARKTDLNFIGSIMKNQSAEENNNSENDQSEDEIMPKRSLFSKFRNEMQSDNEEEVPQLDSINFHDKNNQKTTKLQVYEDYNVMLNLTDVSYGVKGHNKFYQIQVLHRGGKEFQLFTKWGRVGAKNPQSNYAQFPSKYEAILAFKKKFSEKTINDWDDRLKFKQKPGKYAMIQVESAENGSLNLEIEKINKRNAELKSKMQSMESKLEPEIKKLMQLIWDIEKMGKTLRKLKFDVDKCPLGKLTSEQIQKGYKILTEIQNTLLNGGKQSHLIDLTNQFYTNIPQNFGMQRLPMIDHLGKVKEKAQLLDVLKDIDVANKFINIALAESFEHNVNPLDHFFKMLKINIEILDRTDQQFMLIEEMVNNCHGPTHNKFSIKIQNIFKINKFFEKERYLPFKSLNNRSLLWHGSRITNYVGILSEGLKIAPSDAPVTGYMFGKGLYFADVVSKAANYCHASNENPEGILLLCEVALGNMYQIFKAKSFKQPPKYYHSVYGVGRMQTNPEKKIVDDEGVSINLGEVINNEELNRNGMESDLIYNEYVVYDVSQVNIKYLINVKFNFINEV